MPKYKVMGYLNNNSLDQTSILLKEIGKQKTYLVETVNNFKIKVTTDMEDDVYDSEKSEHVIINDSLFRTFVAKVVTTINDEDSVSRFTIVAMTADHVDIFCRNFFGNVIDVKLKESRARFGAL